MRRGITLCGNVIVDSLKTIPTWPDKGMLVQIKSVDRSVGGFVCNDGIDLKSLDPQLPVKAIGKVGYDSDGGFAVDTLNRYGIDTTGVTVEKGIRTTFTDVYTIESTGERTFFSLHGADSRLTPDDVDVDKLDCEIFHLGYLLLLDALDAPDKEYGTGAARLLAKVQAAGIKTSVDIVSEQSDRFARIVGSALKYCDYAVVNEIEASRATGADKDDMRALCEGMMALGVRERVVVHRPEGSASLGAKGDFTEVPSLKLPKGWIKSTVGAGDAFCSGMLYGLLKAGLVWILVRP